MRVGDVLERSYVRLDATDTDGQSSPDWKSQLAAAALRCECSRCRKSAAFKSFAPLARTGPVRSGFQELSSRCKAQDVPVSGGR